MKNTNEDKIKRSKNNGTNEDEAALFLRAVDGVKRIGRAPDPSAVASNRKKAPEKPAACAPEDEQLFLQAVRNIGTVFRNEAPEIKEAARGSRTNRMRQLKGGTLRISEELDLHGLFRDQALSRLERFITSAFNRGQRAVLVITGKGLNSPEGPVLQGAVAEWLQQEGSGLVAEFSSAPPTMGGSGAFVVFLKKKRSTP